MLTILHQYIGAANIKKIREIWFLLLPVCNSLPIGRTDMFPPIYWWNWHVCINILVQLELLPPEHWWNHVSCTIILVVTYAQKFKKGSILNRQCAAMLAAPIMGHGVIFTLFSVYSWHIFSQLLITFEGGVWEGNASYWPSIMRNFCWVAVWHGLIVKDDISTNGWQIC